MKRNEYVKEIGEGEIRFMNANDGEEELWTHDDTNDLGCYDNSDLRWFNFNGFDIDTACIDVPYGKIIGDK